ncbi:hypothetical protein [Ochrovirga pacifica]|uniref:hypothetical protein n=1 Tax=Ochrovirga pacifica TaxID=1042376 RepID=UPI000255A23E|nr:hypothetical protein [Ochrovirga pacifica]
MKVTSLVSFFKENCFAIMGVLLMFAMFIYTADVPFFWDAITKSERATWFYDHHFSQWVVPTKINSGHPPLWTLLLAFSWKVFGKTLLVSRALLLVVNCLVVLQLHQFIKNYGSRNLANSAYLILLLEPTYLAQTTILNNDVLMLFFCLLAANSIFKNRILYAVAITGVLFCNLRGILFFGGFMLWDLVVRFLKFYHKQSRLSVVISYVVPTLIFLAFLGYQYQILGWILKSPSPNWQTQREVAGMVAILKNGIAMIWVFLDYGRFSFWIIGALLCWVCYKNKRKLNAKGKKMIALFLCVLVVQTLLIFSTNPIGHRYLMFLYLVGLFIVINLMHIVWSQKQAILVKTGVAFFLVSAHFWIYPSKIPQGWDSSLAYLNYFEIKRNMYNYVLDQNLPMDQIGTKTRNPSPSIESLSTGFQPYTYCNQIKEVKYYLFSNIENSTLDDEIDTLEKDWKLVKEFQKKGVFIRLYQAP